MVERRESVQVMVASLLALALLAARACGAVAAWAECRPAAGPIAGIGVHAPMRRFEMATVLVELEGGVVIPLGSVTELGAYHNCIRPQAYLIQHCSTPELRVYGEACPEGK